MNVIEIFKSIEGEGIRAGLPAVFIRLAGCNLRCSYCDTKYSYDITNSVEMSISQICDTVKRFNCSRVTLTGGEPLIHNGVDELIWDLTHQGFEVNIETNGSVSISPFCISNTIITMDYKCPSSKMEEFMFLENLNFLRNTDVLKFVVGNYEDLDKCRVIGSNLSTNIFISPVFGKIEPKDIVNYILEHNMNNCRVQLQLHKYIWDPSQRGV